MACTCLCKCLHKQARPLVQELTSKKEEEDRLKALQTAERLARQKENERVRKERERENRLLARQREDERQADLQRKLAGIHPEGPSREERAQRRHRSSQAGSMSSDSGDMYAEESMHDAPSPSHFSSQQQQHDDDLYLVELAPGKTRWITENEKWELRRVCTESSTELQ